MEQLKRMADALDTRDFTQQFRFSAFASISLGGHFDKFGASKQE